jgi:hypothetical protein
LYAATASRCVTLVASSPQVSITVAQDQLLDVRADAKTLDLAAA